MGKNKGQKTSRYNETKISPTKIFIRTRCTKCGKTSAWTWDEPIPDTLACKYCGHITGIKEEEEQTCSEQL
jgi:DNA-directed RNA polymerase subunit RPC12/RpoP